MPLQTVQKHLVTCHGVDKLPYKDLKPVKEDYSWMFNPDGTPRSDYYKEKIDEAEKLYQKKKLKNEEAYINPLKGRSTLSVSSSYGGGESITKLEMLG